MNGDDEYALREFLATRNVPCPACGYNLRGLITGRCPECAEQIVLGLTRRADDPATYISGLVGLAMGTGFSGLLLVYAGLRMTLTGRGGPPYGFLLIIALGTLIEGTLLSFWLKRRASILQLPVATQRWRMAGCWALTLINLAVFAFVVR